MTMPKSTIIAWTDRIIRAGFYLLFIVVPLILTPWNYELFEYNKMMVTYALTTIIVSAWLLKMIAGGKIAIAKTPIDIPILLFFGSQVISTIYSIDPHISWFGYYSRFNGGLWSVISYILLYYAFASNIKAASDIIKLIKVALVTSGVIALYGLLEHFGIDKKLWVQDVQTRVFSTLGQPNWLAAYIVALIPIPVALALKSEKIIRHFGITSGDSDNEKIVTGRHTKNAHRDITAYFRYFSSIFLTFEFIIWTLFSALSFLALLYTRSRSGLFGFAVACAVFWLLVFLKLKNKTSGIIPFAVINVLFAGIMFFNGSPLEQINKYFSFDSWKAAITRPKTKTASPSAQPANPPGSTLLEFGGTESSTIRKYVWEGAIAAWKSSVKTRLVGTGTETFAFAFYQYRPKAHNLTSEWDFLYNKAHNEYLNYLATTGAIGLGTYILFLVSFILWFLKTQLFSGKPQNQKGSSDNTISESFKLSLLQIALFAGWTSLLVTNFFGFSVVVIQLMLFLFPAFIFVMAYSRSVVVNPKSVKSGFTEEGIPGRMLSISNKPVFINGSSLIVSILALYILFSLAKFWYADFLFANGYRYNRSNQFTLAQPYLARAISLNNGEPLYHDEFSTTLAGLSAQLVGQKEATVAADLVKQSLAESDIALSTSPKNVNYWKTRTKIFYTFSDFIPQMNSAAIESLKQALVLSPNDPKIYYNLAILYGRQSDNAAAVTDLQKSIDLKPNYRDSYYALYVFYNEMNKPDQAKEILGQYLTKVDPNDKDFLQRIGKL